MKRILHPSFHYTPSYETDLRKTFERIRRERSRQPDAVASSAQPADEKVLRLDSRKAGSR